MYAVITSGGKQYRVIEGQQLKVEKLTYDVGQTIDIEDVLMVANETNIMVGTPRVVGSKVAAEIIAHGRGEKIKVVKFRRRKHYMRQMGHRQDYTLLKILSIQNA